MSGLVRHNRWWSPEEKAAAIAAWERGEQRKVVARQLGRTPAAVKGVLERYAPKQGVLF